MKYVLLTAATIALSCSPATAQGPVAAVAPPAPTVAAGAAQCELHVWPAERFQAMTTGWGAAFGVLGAIADSAGHADGDKARRSQLASALDSEGQLDALQQLNLVQLLKLSDSKVITHNEPLDRKTINKIMTRRSASKAPCYSELIVMDVFYQKAAVWGRSLRTSFMFRKFGSEGAKPTIKKTAGGNGLKIFPVKPGEDSTAADAELVSIFQKNFTEAAGNFAKMGS